MSQYMTLEEAAEHLGVEYKTVYRLVRSGDIPAGKVGRIYRIREGDLEAYFERQKQHLAEQAGRTGLNAPVGRRCGACDKAILSELSIGGVCQACEREICQACWAIRKVRQCAAHAETSEGLVPPESGAVRDVLQAGGSPGTIDPATIVERLRSHGLPVVTAEEAKLAEESFVRAFAQRLESVEELPDPLSERAIPLRTARVKHTVEATARGLKNAPANLVSRFTLRYGGWGKPKSGLVVEARFLSRPHAFELNGYDAEALGEAELTPPLNELRERATLEECFHVVAIGSPTGWLEDAVKIITQRRFGRAFHDRRVGVGLYDLHADEAHLDESDERLWPFWALLAPARYARQVARCVETLRDLVAKHDCVSLEYAAGELKADASWVRAAFAELKRTDGLELHERPEQGLVLARRLV